MVGTRKASSYGRRVATDFVSVLSQHFTVVSGLAYGIDTVAHETALNQHGNTIAVLAGSVVRVYPSANQNLAEKNRAGRWFTCFRISLPFATTCLPFSPSQQACFRLVAGGAGVSVAV